MHRLKLSFLLLALLLLSACATLTPDFEKPQVNITSFSLDPDSSGLTPRFNIGLQVINPNRSSLNLVGMSYSVEVEGNRILTGAEPNLPTIEGFGSTDFVIHASPDLLGSARLVNKLLTTQHDGLDYTFNAKIDIGSLLPYIKIKESGRFDINTKPPKN